MLKLPAPSYPANVEFALSVKGPTLRGPEVKVPDEYVAVGDPLAPRFWLPVVNVPENSVAGKLKPGRAALRLKSLLVFPVPLSGPGALFVRVIEPLIEPVMPIETLVSSPVAGGNWGQVIVAFDRSVNWDVITVQVTGRVPAAAKPQVATNNITIPTVRTINSDTEHFALIEEPLHATASVPEAWNLMLIFRTNFKVLPN